MAPRLSAWVLVAALVACLVAVAHAEDDVCKDFRAIEVLCPSEYRPMCGSDGVTYGNRCQFMAAKCNLKGALTSIDGECPNNFECPQMCDMMYSPLCGTDGNTYGNLCTLIAARCTMAHDKGAHDKGARNQLLSIQHDGECDAAPVCMDSFEPVCASHGETFSNECALQAAARERGIVLSIIHSGVCESTVKDCDVMCTDDVSPVCGNNGVTYANECELNAARCREGIDWLAVYERGGCDELCPDMCTEMYAPVCSTSGTTFPGLCQFFQSRCEARAQGSQARSIVDHLGECAPKMCIFDCVDNDNAPVCGTDGVTYPNACALARASCLGDDSLSVCHEGACAPKDEPRCSIRCDKKLEEVCGSDGVTYRNPCLLNNEACRRREKISIASRGPCQSIHNEDAADDACANVVCKDGYMCIPQQRECFAPPCPQYSCERRACMLVDPMPVDIEPACDQMCTMEYQPVCGNDGVIYSSPCNLETTSCQRTAQGLNALVPRERLVDCFIQFLRQDWASFAGDKSSLEYSDFAAIVMGMGATPEQATSMFALMDKNNDGVLTEEEFSAFQTTEVPPPSSSDPTDSRSWYDYVVFSLGAVLGVAVITIGVAFIFRTANAPSSTTEPLLG